jgi:superfamily II DNA or RNA helicase
MSLRELDVDSLYIVPEEDLVGEVLIPSLRTARRYDCMSGFFSSASLKDLAPGLAHFLRREGSKMRLLVSPFLSEDDHQAIRKGLATPQEVVVQKYNEFEQTGAVQESALVSHTLECLAYLLASEKLLMKFVFVQEGVFHPKIKLIGDGNNTVAVHGSNNFTGAGLRRNVEQVSVSRSWVGDTGKEDVIKLSKEFSQFWENRKGSYYRVIDAPEAITDDLISEYQRENMPTPDDFWEAYQTDEVFGDGDQRLNGGTVVSEPVSGPYIPDWVEYTSGDWSHQGEAVASWEGAGRRGVLEMATGSGKTVTSLIAGVRLTREVEGLLVVVVAPYKPIVEQWLEECRDFGFDPLPISQLSGRDKKLGALQKINRDLELGIEEVSVVVGTHHVIKDNEYKKKLEAYEGPSLLIADEVHNLGTELALEHLSESFEYRLGLSATPVRQYDPEGTERLFDYFGEVVYKFGLSEAIGRCLVPYDYYVHPVRMTDAEMAEWADLTEKIGSAGWSSDNQSDEESSDISDYLQSLLIRRRKLLETAEEKLRSFYELIDQRSRSDIKHSLVYLSAKDSDQINEVNRTLQREFNLRVHQITYRETSDDQLVEDLLDRFVREEIEMLTAMRVLDEGIDIPEVCRAFILASTTVKRQWVQRRGRVLRRCKRLDKEFAEIHDWLVLPSEGMKNDDWTEMVKGELRRAMEFAKTARNVGAKDGALRTMHPIIEKYLY